MQASDKQVGGTHYRDMVIQPAEFCQLNGLGFLESCVVKRVCRHRSKGGAEDIRKAIHELELILQYEYSSVVEEDAAEVSGLPNRGASARYEAKRRRKLGGGD